MKQAWHLGRIASNTLRQWAHKPARALLCCATALGSLAAVEQLHLPTRGNLDPSVEARVAELLAKMTLEEKCDFLGGDPKQNMLIRGSANAGFPALHFHDGPMGVKGNGSGFASGINTAANWDPAMAYAVGGGIGYEARGAGLAILLGPGVNIVRMPQAGRNFEYFGEDPFLAGQTAAAYIRGVQDQGVWACVKHYAANNQEFNRNGTSSDMDERTLREIYLPAFKAAVEAGVGSVMTAKNPVLGTPSSRQEHLINDILKGDWGFMGLVMSDWRTTSDPLATALHGVDLDMPFGTALSAKTLVPLIEKGQLEESVIDEKVSRLLRVFVTGGFFQRPDQNGDPSVQMGADDTYAAMLRADRGGQVLLKNTGILPLDPASCGTVALLGPAAEGLIKGHGSSYVGGSRKVDLSSAVRQRLGDERVLLIGERERAAWFDALYQASSWQHYGSDYEGMDEDLTPGLRASYWQGTSIEGDPDVQRIQLTGKGPEKDEIPTDGRGGFSWRMEAVLIPDSSGDHVIAFDVNPRYIRLQVGDQILLDTSNYKSGQYHGLFHVQLEAGKEYDLLFEGKERGPDGFRLAWGPYAAFPEPEIAAAAAADTVIFAAGSPPLAEGEAHDRDYRLPGAQGDLIAACAEVNPRCVVVLRTGGAVQPQPWLDSVPALLMAWLPSDLSGEASAQLLFGEHSPSGKLPVSWARNYEDYPASAFYYDNDGDKRVFYEEGVFTGYRGFDKTGTDPLFPFGFGLSYTSFELGEAAVSSESVGAEDVLELVVPVRNTGDRAGAEVIQVYVHDVDSSVPRPPQELKGYAKIHLDAGEQGEARILLPVRDWAFYHPEQLAWVLEPGDFELRIGTSSRNTVHRLPVTLR